MWNKMGINLVIVLLISTNIFSEDKQIDKKADSEKKTEETKKSEPEKKTEGETPKEEVMKVNKVEIATLERFKPLPPRSEKKPGAEKIEVDKVNAEIQKTKSINAVVSLFYISPSEAKTWLEKRTSENNTTEQKNCISKLEKFLLSKSNKSVNDDSGKLSNTELQNLIEPLIK